MLAKFVQVFLVLLAALFVHTNCHAVATQDNKPNCNINTGVDDFVRAHRLQCDANIEEYDNTIAALKERYDQEVGVVQKENEVMLRKLREAREQLRPLELLSLSTKHCVQLYIWQLPQEAAVKTPLDTCSNTALGYFSSSTSTLSGYARSLKSYYDNTLTQALNNCNKTYPNHGANYTLCATQAISKSDDYTISNRNLWTRALSDARCSLESRINTYLDCSFPHQYNIVFTIGKVLTQVQNCIDSFKDGKNNCSNENKCQNVMYMTLADANFLNETIRNPFFGLPSNTKCMQVNFVKQLTTAAKK